MPFFQQWGEYGFIQMPKIQMPATSRIQNIVKYESKVDIKVRETESCQSPEAHNKSESAMVPLKTEIDIKEEPIENYATMFLLELFD